MRRVRATVLAVAVLSDLLWLSSYSWIVGLVPPTGWISEDWSPWFLAEVAAVGAGALAVVTGGLLALCAGAGARRTPMVAVGLGGFAAVMSLLSLAMPAYA